MTATSLDVWRVEDTFGAGPYQGLHKAFTSSCHRYSGGANHPGPRHDNMEANSFRLYRFGFASLKQLHEWFGPIIARHCEWNDDDTLDGWRVSHYRVHSDEIVHGDHQVAFDRDSLDTEMVDQWPLAREFEEVLV